MPEESQNLLLGKYVVRDDGRGVTPRALRPRSGRKYVATVIAGRRRVHRFEASIIRIQEVKYKSGRSHLRDRQGQVEGNGGRDMGHAARCMWCPFMIVIEEKVTPVANYKEQRKTNQQLTVTRTL